MFHRPGVGIVIGRMKMAEDMIGEPFVIDSCISCDGDCGGERCTHGV